MEPGSCLYSSISSRGTHGLVHTRRNDRASSACHMPAARNLFELVQLWAPSPQEFGISSRAVRVVFVTRRTGLSNLAKKQAAVQAVAAETSVLGWALGLLRT